MTNPDDRATGDSDLPDADYPDTEGFDFDTLDTNPNHIHFDSNGEPVHPNLKSTDRDQFAHTIDEHSLSKYPQFAGEDPLKKQDGAQSSTLAASSVGGDRPQSSAVISIQAHEDTFKSPPQSSTGDGHGAGHSMGGEMKSGASTIAMRKEEGEQKD